ERARDRLAQDVEAPLEFVLGELLLALSDEDLAVRRLGRLDRDAERRVVGRHVAPAEQLESFGRDYLGVDVGDLLLPRGVGGAGGPSGPVLRPGPQSRTGAAPLSGQEPVGDLRPGGGGGGGGWVGANGGAMVQVEQDGQRVLDDLVRLLALD